MIGPAAIVPPQWSMTILWRSPLPLSTCSDKSRGTQPRFQGNTPMAGPEFVYVMKGLSKTYPGGKQVLKDIWLSFYPGAKIGIVGVNGAGKSTLMRIMAGQDKEFTGEAWA